MDDRHDAEIAFAIHILCADDAGVREARTSAFMPFLKEMKAFRQVHFQTQISDFHRLTGIAKIDIHY